MKGAVLRVPVDLCGFAISNSFVRPFQVYIALKLETSGVTKFTNTFLQTIADKTGLGTIRAVRNNVNKLIRRNWIGYDRKHKNYWIRGFDTVRKIENCGFNTAAVFHPHYLKTYKQFLTGAYFGYLALYQEKKLRAAARTSYSAEQAALKNFRHFPVALNAIVKILNIPKNKVFRYKAEAAAAGFLSIIPNFTLTDIPSSLYMAYLKSRPELIGRVTVKDGKLQIRNPDLIKSNIFYCRRKKIAL
ncbi:MAG: hypothetical protein WAT43_17845 [Chitinophagales bacterium]